jgi:hypothetical protein
MKKEEGERGTERKIQQRKGEEVCEYITQKIWRRI